MESSAVPSALPGTASARAGATEMMSLDEGAATTTALAPVVAVTTATGTTKIAENNRNDESSAALLRQLENEAYVSSGCGKDKDKDRTLQTFWKVVWPKLEKHGWRKKAGQGSDRGSIFFYPKGFNPGTGGGTIGRDYYNRIKDVLDRLRDKRTPSEGTAIEMFDAECYRLEVEEHRSPRKRKAPPSKGNTSSSVSSSAAAKKKLPTHDAWRDGRRFAQKTSRVGAAYQPSSIPQVGESPAMTLEPIILWSSQAAAQAGLSEEKMDRLLQSVPPNKKFEVLCKLAEQGYNLPDDDAWNDLVSSVPTTNGSDWDAAQKKQFSREIFKHEKNLELVCQSMGIDMKTCLIYYYREFKSSTDYRLMKAIVDDQQYEKTARFETIYDVCAVCGDGGELVICDQCEGEYHLRCMRPPLRSVPEGRWECDECVDRKVLQLRQYLLSQTGLAAARTVEKETDNTNDDDEQEGHEVIPDEDALAVVRRFGKKVSELLAPAEKEGEVEVQAEEVEDVDEADITPNAKVQTLQRPPPPELQVEMKAETESDVRMKETAKHGDEVEAEDTIMDNVIDSDITDGVKVKEGPIVESEDGRETTGKDDPEMEHEFPVKKEAMENT